jgi:FMN phosphatase YigB (HAD superfamily)
VGNSWPSDIEPAVAAGLQAIWIDAPVWAHERPRFGRALTNTRIHAARGLEAVPALVLGSSLHANLT